MSKFVLSMSIGASSSSFTKSIQKLRTQPSFIETFNFTVNWSSGSLILPVPHWALLFLWQCYRFGYRFGYVLFFVDDGCVYLFVCLFYDLQGNACTLAIGCYSIFPILGLFAFFLLSAPADISLFLFGFCTLIGLIGLIPLIIGGCTFNEVNKSWEWSVFILSVYLIFTVTGSSISFILSVGGNAHRYVYSLYWVSIYIIGYI